MLALTLIFGCAAPLDLQPDTAGCTLVELRTIPGEASPWLQRVFEWDDVGQLVYEDRTILGGAVRRDVVTHEFDDDGRLIEESYLLERGSSTSLLLDRYTNAGDQRLRTERYSGTSRDNVGLDGVWSFTYDLAGLPTGGTWDAGGDGSVDGERVERWSELAFGWSVDVFEAIDGEPDFTELQERDEARRLLWQSTDWDGDAVTDRVEQLTYDGEAVATRDVAGPLIVNEFCAFVLEDGRQLGSTCRNQLFPGVFEERLFHLGNPARPHVGAAVYLVDDGTTVPWDFIDLEWTCR